MSDTSQGPGWWQASDGKWYPPEQAPSGGAITPAGGGAATVDIGGAFSYGWNKFSQNAGPLLVAVLVMWALLLIVQLIGFGFRSLILRLIVGLVAVLIGAVASFGLANISLKLVNGQPVEISDALPKGDLVMSYAITAIIIQIIVTIGLYLCVIPGIIAAVFLWFGHFVVLDEGVAPGDAISRSTQLVKGQAGSVFGFIILAALINFVGAILCGIGLLVTIPLTTVAAAYVYKGLKGEPVAA
jgi:uncharacterized membrane protein